MFILITSLANKTLHSKKSLLNSLEKIIKHDPLHKDNISIEDYHLFNKNDIFYEKVKQVNYFFDLKN